MLTATDCIMTEPEPQSSSSSWPEPDSSSQETTTGAAATEPTTKPSSATNVTFGPEYIGRLVALLQSKEPTATQQLREIYENTLRIYEENGWEEYPGWRGRTGTESAPAAPTDNTQRVRNAPAQVFSRSKAPQQQQQRPKELQPITESKGGKTSDAVKAAQEQAPTAKRAKLGSFDSIDRVIQCSKCGAERLPDNLVLSCAACGTNYHQNCHSPPMPSADARDPLFIFYCAACTKAKQQTNAQNMTTTSSGNLRDVKMSSTLNAKPTTTSAVAAPPVAKGQAVCAKCNISSCDTGNALVQCKVCNTLYHQNCHKPRILDDQLAKSSFTLTCTDCQLKSFSAKAHEKTTASAAPKRPPEAKTPTGGSDSSSLSWKERVAQYKAKQEQKQQQETRIHDTTTTPSAALAKGEKLVANMRKKAATKK